MKTVEFRGAYLLNALRNIEKNGDSYTDIPSLTRECHRMGKELSADDLAYLIETDYIREDGGRLYLPYTLKQEEAAAALLYKCLENNRIDNVTALMSLQVDGTPLCAEQRRAISLALSYRLFMILGGAGTGKTTLIRGILEQYLLKRTGILLAAPTGKAAVNLSQKTGYQAITIQSALGLGMDPECAYRVDWNHTGLVIVDEASMMTTEMLAKILKRSREDCHVILLGDPNQLLSVGAGDVINDLKAIGVPWVQLWKGHRQQKCRSALAQNVENFSWCASDTDLLWDDSFQFWDMSEIQTQTFLCEEAARRYIEGEDVQLLSAVNNCGPLSVQALNRTIHPMVNDCSASRTKLWNGRDMFLNGDRILVTQNQWDIGCCNGDTGYLRLDPEENDLAYAALDLDRGQVVYLCKQDHLLGLKHGYAITVHKSQGSEYNTIILPVAQSIRYMLKRNLLYTAISRAKEKVILVGNRSTLKHALQTKERPRNSGITERLCICEQSA